LRLRSGSDKTLRVSSKSTHCFVRPVDVQMLGSVRTEGFSAYEFDVGLQTIVKSIQGESP